MLDPYGNTGGNKRYLRLLSDSMSLSGYIRFEVHQVQKQVNLD